MQGEESWEFYTLIALYSSTFPALKHLIRFSFGVVAHHKVYVEFEWLKGIWTMNYFNPNRRFLQVIFSKIMKQLYFKRIKLRSTFLKKQSRFEDKHIPLLVWFGNSAGLKPIENQWSRLTKLLLVGQPFPEIRCSKSLKVEGDLEPTKYAADL